MAVETVLRSEWRPYKYFGNFENANWHLMPVSANDSELLAVDARGKNPEEVIEVVGQAKQLACLDRTVAVDMDDCRLGDYGVKKVAPVLNDSIVTEVRLSDNCIGQAGAESIAYLLSQCTKLDLAFNELGNEGICAICAPNVQWCCLLHLSLRDNDLYPPGAQTLAVGLAKAPHLLSLNLRQNFIQDDGAEALCKVLQKHDKLVALDLRENSMHATGAGHVARLLESNTTIATLALCRNDVGDVGAESVAKALKVNTTLRNLWLQDCRIGDAGGKLLGQAVSRNKYIIKIDVRTNPISQVSSRYIGQACGENRKRAQRIAQGLPSSEDDW